MNSFVLRNGRVIDPASGVDRVLDLWVEGETVSALEPSGAIGGREGVSSIDVREKWVVPGLIDVHCHLRDPGFPERETIPDGLRAAARGGFVMVAAMANTSPPNDCPEVTAYMIDRARKSSGAELVPVGAVTRGLVGREVVDFESLAAAGVRLFSDDGFPIDDPQVLKTALRAIRSTGLRISLHEEERSLSHGRGVNDGPAARRLGLAGAPAEAESRRVERDLQLASEVNAPVHLAHVSTRASLLAVRRARQKGVAVTCEATPHHFTLDEGAVLRFGPNAKMSPPLRSAADVEAIKEGLADGTIDIIATDHAPHDSASKATAMFPELQTRSLLPQPLPEQQVRAFEDAANGIVGLETALGLALDLVHQGVLSPARLVELMSVAPARLLGVGGGTLRVGAVANITVIDPVSRWQVEPEHFYSRGRNTPFVGRTMKGRAIMTIVRGRIVFDLQCGGLRIDGR